MTAAVTLAALGNGPAFSAYQNVSQTIPDATPTKIQFQAEEFDTNSCYDNTTNYRFTPTVAGYYQVNALVFVTQTPQLDTTIWLYKNGAVYKRGFGQAVTTSQTQIPISCLVYLNGSTDYIEIYLYSDGTGVATANQGSANVWFQAAMVRGA